MAHEKSMKFKFWRLWLKSSQNMVMVARHLPLWLPPRSGRWS